MLLLVLLAQLSRPTPMLPAEPVPACSVRGISVWCQAGCLCSEVESRLELAATELASHWAACPADFWSGLRGWRLFITNRQTIDGPKGEALYGVVVLEERRVVLTFDMRAALHELAHVQELRAGPVERSSIYDHPEWDRDPALREIDGRFRQRFRGKPP